MDAIKKKMLAMKMDKENALDRAEQMEQKLRDTEEQKNKLEEDLNTLQKKYANLENEYDKANEGLIEANTKLEASEKRVGEAPELDEPSEDRGAVASHPGAEGAHPTLITTHGHPPLPVPRLPSPDGLVAAAGRPSWILVDSVVVCLCREVRVVVVEEEGQQGEEGDVVKRASRPCRWSCTRHRARWSCWAPTSRRTRSGRPPRCRCRRNCRRGRCRTPPRTWCRAPSPGRRAARR